MNPTRIKTRILIISDTHGAVPKVRSKTYSGTDDELDQADITKVPTGFRHPLPKADVALHCGDLTTKTNPEEYKNALEMLRGIKAPLKLVIAGNHDMALDQVYWGGSMRQVLYDPDMKWHDTACQIIDDAKFDGVRFLDEGVHTFDLTNGARLKVYASQWTPEFGGWGFQYFRHEGHKFDIPSDVDIAMTHGPPNGILDYAGPYENDAGCEHLFESIYRAKPKIHCFGHIHEAWGAYLAKWEDSVEPSNSSQSLGHLHESWDKQKDSNAPSNPPTLKTVCDPEGSKDIKNVKGHWQRKDYKLNDEDMRELKENSKRRGVLVDLTEGENKIEEGRQTLFVNASIMDIHYQPTQLPWLVDVNLPAA